MNKKELITAVSEKVGITKSDVEKVLNALIDVIVGQLKKKKDVRLIGFGTFTTAKRAARTYRNPANGKAVKAPATIVPRFRAGKALKDAMPKK